MSRTVLGTVVLLLAITILVAGGYYFSPDPGTDPRGAGSIGDLLPEKVTGFVRVNLTRGTFRQLQGMPLANALRGSRFPEAFRKRILPLLSFATNRLKANRPFPSRFLLRYLDNSKLHFFREQEGGFVGVVEFSRFGEARPPAEVRNHLRTWILEPARRHDAWSVREENLDGIPFWTLRRSLPGFDRTVSVSVGLAVPYLVVSRRRADLVRTLRRYRRASNSREDSGKVREGKYPVEFVFGEGFTRRNLMSDTFPMKPESGTIESVGRVSVRGERLVLEVESSGKRIGRWGDDRADSTLLRYHSGTSALVLQAADLGADDGIRWFRTIAERPYTTLLAKLDRRLVHSPTFSVRRPLSERGGSSRSLLALKVLHRDEFRRGLREDPGVSYDRDAGRITLKGVRTKLYFRWHRDRFLLSRDPRVPGKAIDRFLGRDGFLSRLRSEDLDSHTRAPYQLVAYGSTAQALDDENLGRGISDRWVQRTRLLLGFDPLPEVRKIAGEVPGTLLVVRPDGQGHLATKLVMAGDPFLPVYSGWKFLRQRTSVPSMVRSLGRDLEVRLRNSLN